MRVWANFYVRYRYKHKKISSNICGLDWYQGIFLNILAIRRIICASLGEFLCAKFEKSLQTEKQKKISPNRLFGVVPRHISGDPI